MRILHCISSLSVGGAERQLSILAPAQAKTGLDVHVAVMRGGQHLERLTSNGIEVHTVPATANHDPRIGMGLSSIVRKVRPSLVQTWLPQMDFFGGIAAKTHRVPWLISERSAAAAYTTRVKDRFLRVRVGAMADGIVANSKAGALYWLEHVAPRMLFAMIPNALPIEEIEAAVPVVPENAKAGEFLLLVGRLSPEKNLDLFLEALSIVARSREVRAVICGEGPMRQMLLSQIEGLGLEGKVSLEGNRNDVWGLMKTAAALINPSEFEGNPNVVLEAAAAGTPLILSDIDAHRDIVGRDGAEFFGLPSAPALAESIARTLDDAGAAKAKAEITRQVAQRFSIGHAVRAYQRVYTQLAK